MGALLTRALLAMCALAGCFKPSPQEGFACGPDHWCPDPLHCASDGTCRRTDSGSDAAIGSSGDGGPDGDGSRANLAFVMSTTMTAKALGPPAAADAKCTQFANAHGHPGMFVAWISTMTNSVRTRLASSRGWVRTDGRPFVDTLDNLFAGKIYYPLRKNEQRGDTAIAVMTGTNNDGTGNGEDCGGFTSDLDTDLMSLGASDAGTSRWTQYDEQHCNLPFGVYCLEVGHDVAISPPSEVGRIAFVSKGTFNASGTITAADTLCQSEASAANYTGTFLAFLATTQGSALSRFTPSNQPWVRVDGAATTATFGTWDAPIAVTTGSDYVDDYVFSGAASPTVAAANGQDNCNNWTSPSGTGRCGFSAHAGPEAFGAVALSCTPHRVLCLQL